MCEVLYYEIPYSYYPYLTFQSPIYSVPHRDNIPPYHQYTMNYPTSILICQTPILNITIYLSIYQPLFPHPHPLIHILPPLYLPHCLAYSSHITHLHPIPHTHYSPRFSSFNIYHSPLFPLPGEGTLIHRHGREVPRFLRVAIRLGPNFMHHHELIDTSFCRKTRFISITFSSRDTWT